MRCLEVFRHIPKLGLVGDLINGRLLTYSSIADKNDESIKYGSCIFSTLWPSQNVSCLLLTSSIINRNNSPRYNPATIFSIACWPFLGDASSIAISKDVNGSTTCSLSKAPHSQLIAMSASAGRPSMSSLGMDWHL